MTSVIVAPPPPPPKKKKKKKKMDTGNLARVITVRTYIVVVFDNEPLSAGVTQLYEKRCLAID